MSAPWGSGYDDQQARLDCEQSVATHWRQVRQRHLAEDPSAVLRPDRGPERLVGTAAALEPMWRASAAPAFHMAVPPVSCARFEWQRFGRTCAQGLAELVGESVGAGTLCGMTPRRARPIIYALRNSTGTVGRGLVGHGRAEKPVEVGGGGEVVGVRMGVEDPTRSRRRWSSW